MRMTALARARARHLVPLAAAAVLLLAGCAQPSTPTPTPTAAPIPSPGALVGIATFEVAGDPDETYRIGLATPELLEHAQQLLEGEEVAAIPVGTVVRGGDGGVNAPWTWYIDPSTLEFADFTTEVCDGLPSFVEREEVTSPDYCPWLAKVTDVEVLG
jgi:hypothetical protein